MIDGLNALISPLQCRTLASVNVLTRPYPHGTPAKTMIISTIYSSTCASGRYARNVSSGVKWCPRREYTPPILAMRLACVMVTPFGAPVEPEVYMMQARSSGLGIREASISSDRDLPRSSSSPIVKIWTEPSTALIDSSVFEEASPSYTTVLTDVLASTFASVGRSSAFVKTAAQFGSVNECAKPSSPSVSYAVAIVVAIVAHA